ncbi:phosphoglycerate mutase-like protein 2 [Camellia sinensis]|uniref:phosphoglycerate mutase-like protein 2 n=1 Tax=Camellia sinensis TaxID=4442 RepID=UPI0010360E75|nr:phosphoglycerate mutase-like protein 2 [Camellia sinensis]
MFHKPSSLFAQNASVLQTRLRSYSSPSKTIPRTQPALNFASSFANCELHSMVIVDKSMSESDPPTTNYPGKIPPDHDAPSDVVDEKN